MTPGEQTAKHPKYVTSSEVQNQGQSCRIAKVTLENLMVCLRCWENPSVGFWKYLPTTGHVCISKHPSNLGVHTAYSLRKKKKTKLVLGCE